MNPSFAIIRPDAENSAEALATVDAIMRGQQKVDGIMLRLYGVSFDGVDFRAAELDEFWAFQSVFRNCNFNSVFLHDAQFSDCIFENCDLSGIGFVKGKFYDCSMVNVILDGANARRSEFYGNTMKSVSFVRTDLLSASFWECDLRETMLSPAILDETRFNNCMLSAADANLPGAEYKYTERRGQVKSPK